MQVVFDQHGACGGEPSGFEIGDLGLEIVAGAERNVHFVGLRDDVRPHPGGGGFNHGRIDGFIGDFRHGVLQGRIHGALTHGVVFGIHATPPR